MGMTPEIWDQLTHLREDRQKLLDEVEKAKLEGDEDEVEFQETLAGEISEKIQELEEKYGTNPPLPDLPNTGPSSESALAMPEQQVQQPQQQQPAPALLPNLPALPKPPSLPPGLPSNLPNLGALLRPLGLPGLAATGAAPMLGIQPGLPGGLRMPGQTMPQLPGTLLQSPGLPNGLIPPGIAGALAGQRPGMPNLPGVPGLPGPPGILPGMGQGLPPGLPQMQMLGVQAQSNFTQQQAVAFDQAKASSTALEPEVVELVHYFKISDRHARMLNEQLKRRNNTYDEDIAAMYEILKGAKNPADLLMVSIRWMEKDVFRGSLTPNPLVEKAAKKYKLDAPSACKLAESLESREDPDGDLEKICTHLAASNKPSSLVMIMLKDIKSGAPIANCTKQPAIGSYLHKKETSANDRKQSSRSRDRGFKYRSNRGSRSRDRRSPSRGRRRSRGRGGRSRSRRGDRDDRGGRGGDRGRSADR